MARCHVCQPEAAIADEEILNHVRLLHPEQWGDGIECWPDGSPVIVDLTLEVGDFGPEANDA